MHVQVVIQIKLLDVLLVFFYLQEVVLIVLEMLLNVLQLINILHVKMENLLHHHMLLLLHVLLELQMLLLDIKLKVEKHKNVKMVISQNLMELHVIHVDQMH